MGVMIVVKSREMVLACHKAEKSDLDLSNLFEEEVVYCGEAEVASMAYQEEE